VDSRVAISAPVGFRSQASAERRYRPLALAVLRVEERRVVEVVHWDRPELSEAFGLPMRFRPLRGSNE
jgi:hypothetical protein